MLFSEETYFFYLKITQWSAEKTSLTPTDPNMLQRYRYLNIITLSYGIRHSDDTEMIVVAIIVLRLESYRRTRKFQTFYIKLLWKNSSHESVVLAFARRINTRQCVICVWLIEINRLNDSNAKHTVDVEHSRCICEKLG